MSIALPLPPAVLRSCEQALRELDRRSDPVVGAVSHSLRQEQPRQRGVLELVEVAELVRGRDTMLPRPAPRRRQVPLGDPHPRLLGGDRAHIGGVVARIQGLGLLEELERAIEIAFCLSDPGRRDTRPVGVLRQAVLIPQLAARQQVLRRGLEVVAFATQLAHAHVHVRRPPQRGRAMFGRKLQSPLERAHRIAEATLGDPDVGLDGGAADDVREVTGLLQVRHALGVRNGALPRDPHLPRQRVPAIPLPHHARPDRPRRRGRAPAGHGSWCRPRRRWPWPGPHGRGRSNPGDGGTPPGRRRPSQSLGPLMPRARRPSHPATVPRPAIGPRRSRSRRRPAASRHRRRSARAWPGSARREVPRASGARWPPDPPGTTPGSRAPPGPPPARHPRPPSRGGSPRSDRRTPRTTRTPDGAAPAPARVARRGGAPAARRRRGGGSGTTGGGRRAGRGTGSLDPAPRALALPPSWPVTASHNGPVMRARIDVSSRKLRTCSGCRCRTSSTR